MSERTGMVAGSGAGRRWRPARVAAWSLCGAGSAAVFLLSLLAGTATAATSQAVLLAVLLLLVGALVVLLAGVGLLVWAYRAFFAGRWGVWLWLGVILAALLAVWARPEGSVWATALGEVAAAWGLGAMLALGPTLWLYLLRTDRGAGVFALVMLLQVWLLYSAGQFLGWDELLRRLTSAGAGLPAMPMQVLLCLTIWVFIVSPLAFLWHTFVLVGREAAAAPMAVGTADTADAAVAAD